MNKTKRSTLSVLVLLNCLLMLTGVVLTTPGAMAVELVPVEVFTDDSDVCASVKMEISQELTLERQAFDAHMRINNALSSLTMEDVGIEVLFEDNEGNPVLASSNTNDPNALFFIRVDRQENINDINGAGIVNAQTTADIHWLIIPAPGASNGNPFGTQYFVGAELTYTLNGETTTVEVNPDYIFVKPMPDIVLDYFLPIQVYGDDAFTADITEPIVPFTLGVRAMNTGNGVAENFKIDSAQPKITENNQGLLVDFAIIGSSVNGNPAEETLLANFGDIDSGASSVARWTMTCTLSGTFDDFTAQYSHSDALGGELTSLIQSIGSHMLVHNVYVDLPGRDIILDFLALDDGAYGVYESEGTDSTVTDQSSLSSLVELDNSGTEVSFTLTTPVTAGFIYIKLPDPGNGTYEIQEVIRSDGKRIKADNVWLSKEREDGNPRNWLHYFNLFDANTTGSYTIIIVPIDEQHAPVLAPISNRSVEETDVVAFTISANDADSDPITLSTSQLPRKASFSDNGDGTGSFNWPTEIGQQGDYPISFTASDGEMTDTKNATISVFEEGGMIAAVLNESYSGTEGIAVTLDGTQSIGSITSYEWDLDDDGIYDMTGATISYTWQDDYSGNITLRVSDGTNFSTVSAPLTIYNGAPVITGLPLAPVTTPAYEPVVLQEFTFTDVGTADTHTASIDWGDGTTTDVTSLIDPVTRTIDGSVVSHEYENLGDYDALLTVTDDDGGTDTQTIFTVTVDYEDLDLIDVIVEPDMSNAVRVIFKAVPGKEYNILYTDNEGILNDAVDDLNEWTLAGTIIADEESEDDFTDQGSVGVSGIPDRSHPSTVPTRYYRVILSEAIIVGSRWLASPSIGFSMNKDLWNGRNFMGKIGNHDAITHIFDCRFLPGGTNQTDSTYLHYWENQEHKLAFVHNNNGVNEWLSSNGTDLLDTSEEGSDVLEDGAGALISLQPWIAPVPYILPMAGIVEMDETVDVTVLSNGYTLVTWPYGNPTPIEDAQLITSGFKGGIVSHLSDEIFFFNADTQAYDLAVYYCNLPAINKWLYHNQVPCTKILQPGESFLIKTQNSTFSTWHVERPYNPTKFMEN